MFYVYVYRDPRPNKNNVPVYVGKGQDETDRAECHWNKPETCHNKHLRYLLLLLKREGLTPDIQILQRFETEKEAHAKEIELISLFGRADLKRGPLFNNTDGGEGLVNIGPEALARRTASLIATMNTLEAKARNKKQALKNWADATFREERLREIHTRSINPEYRAKLSESISAARGTEESRKKTSEASTKLWQDAEYRRDTLAAQKEGMETVQAQERRGAATKAGWENPDTRKKRVDGIRASKTPELRAKVSEKCKALWDEETRAAQSERMKAACATPEAKANRIAAAKAAWAKRKYVAVFNKTAL